MKASRAAAFLLAVLFCGIAAASTSAATLIVTKTADTNDGVCDADCSLREAVAVAAADDTVIFSSLFNEPQTINLTLGQIAITRNLTITGTGRALLTISGSNASRIFAITGGPTVSLTGMKLTNGLAPNGGALAIADSSVNLTNLNIVNNVARDPGQPTNGDGGGILVIFGTLTILNSSISNNTVPSLGRGGGIRAPSSTVSISALNLDSNSGSGYDGFGVLTVVDSTVRDNTGAALLNSTGRTTVIGSTISNNGGGIGGGDSMTTLTIDRSIISGNHTGGVGNSGTATITNSVIRNNENYQFGRSGGGIGNTGTMYILNTTIVNNAAFDSGGGIYNASGDLYLTNSTVSGNYVLNGSGNSPCPGGGIANHSSQTDSGMIVMTNVTVANNSAKGSRGGVCNQTGGTVVTRNSIFALNLGTPPTDFFGAVNSEGTNLVGTTAGSSGWIASDLLNINPLLAPLGNNGGATWTHAVLPGSPAINVGNNKLARDPYNNSLLISDQRGKGFARVVDGNVDIGAYEANYAIGPVNVGGRVVVTVGGRGVSKARIAFTDPLGHVSYTQTNPFGYYRFLNLLSGTTYTVTVSHKSYQFDSPQIVTIDQPRDNLDFVAF